MRGLMGALSEAGWGRYGWPEEVGRPGRHDPAPGRYVGGAGPPWRAGHGTVRAPRDPRTGAGRHGPAVLRHRRAPRVPRRPAAVGAGVLRAGRRLRPRQPPHHGARRTRRRVRGERPEDLDELGPLRDLVPAARPHRHPRVAPPRPHRADRRPARPRGRGDADRAGERHRRARRGHVRRRPRARRPRRRRDRRRLAGGDAHPQPRARHVRVVPAPLPVPAPGELPRHWPDRSTTRPSATRSSTSPQ